MDGVNARARRSLGVFRVVVLTLAAAYFLIPLVSMFDFSVRFPLTGKVDANAWLALVAPDDSGRLDLLRHRLAHAAAE